MEHWRGVVVAADYLIVWDGLAGAGNHRLELYWHLGVDLDSGGGSVLGLDSEGGTMPFALQGGSVDVFRGSLSPIAGWRSPRYGCKVPITTVRVSHEGRLPHEFVTILSFSPAQAIADSVISAAVEALRRKAGWV